MRNDLRFLGSLAAAVVLAACSAQTSPPQLADFDLTEAADGTQQYSRHDRDPQLDAQQDDAAPLDAQSIEKAGCVHIQWCNAPGPRGVVCVQDKWCYGDDVVIECLEDALYVCGDTFNDFYIDWL